MGVLDRPFATTRGTTPRSLMLGAVPGSDDRSFFRRVLGRGRSDPGRRLRPPMGTSDTSAKVRHPPGYPLEGFFLARDDEVSSDLVEYGPGPAFAGFEVKIRTPVEVAMLGELLGAGEYDALLNSMVETFTSSPSEEAGLFRVAPEITRRLATLDEVETVASQWCATEELQLAGWTEQETQEVLLGLARLARQGENESKRLWVWWSL